MLTGTLSVGGYYVKMNLINQKLFSLALCLALGFISRNAGLQAGVEFKHVKFCGKIYSTNSRRIIQNNLTAASFLPGVKLYLVYFSTKYSLHRVSYLLDNYLLL